MKSAQVRFSLRNIFVRDSVDLSMNYFLLVLISLCVVSKVASEDSTDGLFVPSWACQIPGGEDAAKQVAKDHEMIHRGKVK